MTKRERVYRQLNPAVMEGLSKSNLIILILVLTSVLVAIVETEQTIRALAPKLFDSLTLFFAVVFAIEYGIRLWAMGEDEDYSGFWGRIRYARTLSSIFDLLATLALWVEVLVGVGGVYGVMLRLVRALRVITLGKNSALGIAIKLLVQAILFRKFELLLSFGLALTVLLGSATALFFFEGRLQPEAFGSIPRSMWWAVATLTTVGYGDVYPVTAWGKFFASIVALTSIAIVAMPTGIMAAAFSDAFQKMPNKGDTGPVGGKDTIL